MYVEIVNYVLSANALNLYMAIIYYSTRLIPFILFFHYFFSFFFVVVFLLLALLIAQTVDKTRCQWL